MFEGAAQLVKRKQMIDVAVLGLAACHVSEKNAKKLMLVCRYVTPASQSHISHECSPFRWAISCKHEIAPSKNKLEN